MRKKISYALVVFGLLAAAFASVQNTYALQTMQFSADDVENMMLESAFSVQQTRIKSAVAKEDIPQAKSIYDTHLGAGASEQIDKSKKISPIFGNRVDTTTWEMDLRRKFPTGTEAGVNFTTERLKYFNPLTISGNPIYPPNATYEPILAFSLAQPLLKNAGGYIDRRTVRSAEIGSLATELASQREIETIVYEALADYWNLVIIRKHIAAMHKSVNFAKQFLSTTLEEFKLGTVEETDVLAARANVLVREDDLLASKEMERVWEERLRVKLGLGPDIKIANKEKTPPFIKLGEQMENEINIALENRRDYMASKQELEQRNVNLAIAKNQRWPALDLYGSLELNDIDSSYSKALGSMDSPNMVVGMRFSVPLENRYARAGKKKADLQRASAIISLKDLENRIANSVVRSYEEVKSRRHIVIQSEKALNLQIMKLQQEMKKYSMGRSSSDLIVRYQDDAVNAERSNIEALLAYQKSVLDLRLSKGVLVTYPQDKEESKEE